MAARFAPTTAETSLVQAIFGQHDTRKLGIIAGDVAVKVFGGAHLPPTTLGEIWSIADEDNNGWLSRKGVAIALRLIGWAQQGERITQDLINKPGPMAYIEGVAAIAPENTGISEMSAPKSPPPPAFPPLTPEERTKFLALFQKAGPGPDGLLSGDQARDFFLRSKLDNDQLLKIWSLADTQDRGLLDSADFAIAMYFIQGLMSRTITSVPTSLPPELYEQASGQGVPSAGGVRSHMTGDSKSGFSTSYRGNSPQNRAPQSQYTGQNLLHDHRERSLSTPVASALRAQPTTSALDYQNNDAPAHWDVTATEKATADRYFTELDTQGKGYIEGEVAATFMLKSDLPNKDLALIWDFADLNHNGQLTKDGFAIVVHLIQKKLAGTELPDTLPQSLIPPSMRSTATSAFSSPFSLPAQQQNSQQSEPVRDLLWDSDTPPPSATVAQRPQPNIFGKAFIPPSKNPDPIGAVAYDFPFDFNEPVTAHHTKARLQDKSTEIMYIRNQLNSTNRSLETAKDERAVVEKTLANQAVQLMSLRTELSSAKALLATENKWLARLREDHTSQMTELQTTREKLIRAESDLIALQVEKGKIDGDFLGDKEEAEDLHRKMIDAGQEVDAIRVEVEKAKKDAKQQKELLVIAKKQLRTKEAEAASIAASFGGTQGSALLNTNTPSTQTENSVVITSGMISEMICANEVADFLQKEQDTIRHGLNRRLLAFGYSGDYLLCAGFNEALLRRGIEHPEVFLVLNGDLEDDDAAISKDISPIFSPYTTVLYMESRVLNLVPPNELRRPPSSQEPSASPALIHQLNSSIQSQSIETSGGSQSDEQGDQGSAGDPSRNSKEKDKNPDGERDEEKQMDKGKEKTKAGDDVPGHYRRQLELRLRAPLRIISALSKESSGRLHEFNVNTKIHIKLRSNRGGIDWNDLAKGVVRDPAQDSPQDLPQDPLCSVSFEKITTSRGGTALHSLTALMVHLEATPSQTECEELLPRPNRYTDIKISNDTRTKGGGSTTLGPKPEFKLELAREKGVREESTRPAWSIHRHEIPKEDAYVVTVEYRLNGSEEVPDEEFRPGPSAIFSYESDQTDRSLRISVRAFWSLRLDPDSLKNRLRRFFDKLTVNAPNLIYGNFFHKFSFSIDLRDLMREGTDDELLRGKNVFVDGDKFQHCRDARDSKFEAMPIHVTRGGKDAIITVPLRRAVIAAIRKDKWEEGDQQVTSPD